MILHMELFHESSRLLLYTPFWIINQTRLKLEFQVRIWNLIFILKFFDLDWK